MSEPKVALIIFGDERPTLATYTDEQTERRKKLEEQIAALEKQIAEQVALQEPELSPPSGPLTARFVRIELPGKQKLLSLAEVQVLVDGENAAARDDAKHILEQRLFISKNL